MFARRNASDAAFVCPIDIECIGDMEQGNVVSKPGKACPLSRKVKRMFTLVAVIVMITIGYAQFSGSHGQVIGGVRSASGSRIALPAPDYGNKKYTFFARGWAPQPSLHKKKD